MYLKKTICNSVKGSKLCWRKKREVAFDFFARKIKSINFFSLQLKLNRSVAKMT